MDRYIGLDAHASSCTADSSSRKEPTSRIVESSRLGRFTAERFMGLVGTRSLAGRYVLGVANGFLPCGPVFARVAVGLAAGRLAPDLQRKFNLVAAILVMVVGLEFLFRAS